MELRLKRAQRQITRVGLKKSYGRHDDFMKRGISRQQGDVKVVLVK
jgi:hypothetical protein